jgi:hypothetical protein
MEHLLIQAGLQILLVALSSIDYVTDLGQQYHRTIQMLWNWYHLVHIYTTLADLPSWNVLNLIFGVDVSKLNLVLVNSVRNFESLH